MDGQMSKLIDIEKMDRWIIDEQMYRQNRATDRMMDRWMRNNRTMN